MHLMVYHVKPIFFVQFPCSESYLRKWDRDFLAPLIQDVGWPFQSTQDSLLGTDWHRILYPLLCNNSRI